MQSWYATMVNYSIFGIAGGILLLATGLLMGYVVFPPMVKSKIAEVSFLF